MGKEQALTCSDQMVLWYRHIAWNSKLCHFAYHEIRCDPSSLSFGKHLTECLFTNRDLKQRTSWEANAMCNNLEIKILMSQAW
jgi:hypothetical protein